MKTFIRENTGFKRDLNLSDFDIGWGNGYVLIPKYHPFYNVSYDYINQYIDIHVGLTFSGLVDFDLIKDWELDQEDEGKWCVGFDTAHYGDNILKWPKERVEEETEKLKQQLLFYSYE